MMRVLYIADILPQDTSSGAKVIYRHLGRLAQTHSVHVAHWSEAPIIGVTSHRLSPRNSVTGAFNSRRKRYVEALDAALGFRIADSEVQRVIELVRPDVLLTVAQGGLCHNVRRLSRRLKIPMAIFFHDWSPDWRLNPRWMLPLLDWSFQKIYRSAEKPLCVSLAMIEALGRNPSAEVLYPIPRDRAATGCDLVRTSPVGRTVYTGILNGLYQDEIYALAEYCAKTGEDRLTFFGPNPHWSDPIGQKFLQEGLYQGLIPEEKYSSVVAGADALLVIMPFGENHRRFAACSFPSKLVEYTGVGRPILIWGPAYSSAVRWANETGGALVVSDPHPSALVAAVAELAGNEARQRDLAERAQAAYQRQFAPAILQGQFERALDSIAPADSSAET